MNDLTTSIEKLKLVLAHPGRRQVFESMRVYDEEAAWRYVHFCCSPPTYSDSEKDWQLLLEVLPIEEENAIALAQICDLIYAKNPFYNRSPTSRYLDELAQLGKIGRKLSSKSNQFGNRTYVYWRKS